MQKFWTLAHELKSRCCLSVCPVVYFSCYVDRVCFYLMFLGSPSTIPLWGTFKPYLKLLANNRSVSFTYYLQAIAG